MFFQLYYSTRQVAVCRILSKRDDRHGIGQTLAKFTHCRSSTSFIEEDARLLQIYVLAYYWDMMMMTCKHCLEGSTRDDHHLLLLILLWERRGQHYSDAVRGRRNHREVEMRFFYFNSVEICYSIKACGLPKYPSEVQVMWLLCWYSPSPSRPSSKATSSMASD